jgi:hypothetical protein
MFKKIFFGGNKRRNRKKRLSPSATTREGIVNSHPMYQYAMKEYAQTVPQGQQQDVGGRIRPTFSMNDEEAMVTIDENNEIQVDLENHNNNTTNTGTSSTGGVPTSPGTSTTTANPTPILRVPSYRSDNAGSLSHQYQQRIVFSPKTEYVLSEDDEEDSHHYYSSSRRKHPSSPRQPPPSTSTTNINNNGSYYYHHAPAEPPMPDTTYEEWYGDAYVGGPIRYVYPSGYQSMRPRSGPWKLSIVVCLLFTWLSVFIIGHCSDKSANNENGDGNHYYVNNYYYNQNNNNNNNNNNANGADGYDQQQQIDDDTFNIEKRWCGSRLLYWMWVISMLITGLATAYCSVIGYIKVRDFAVANSRSQPPGVAATNKSDYYVQITDHHRHPTAAAGGGGGATSGIVPGPAHPSQYSKTIYQADGTPQFWGNQIYRPTQAAVAITSR